MPMKKALRLQHLLSAGAIALMGIVTSAGAGLPFPSIPSTRPVAIATFNERAKTIVNFNACSREGDYLTYRSEMRGDGSPFAGTELAGNYIHEGEELTGILIAKIAWVRSNPDNAECVGLMFRPRPRNADRSFVQATIGEFAVADRAIRAAEPLLCGTEPGIEHEIADDILVEVRLNRACMLRQVNESIRAMRKVGQMGSSDLVCVESFDTKSSGEWDVNVRELVRLLYYSRPSPIGQQVQSQASLLEPATVEHMYLNLLAARGAPSANDYSQLGDCSEPAGDELGTPEDTADRHAWYRELWDGIGDVFHWFYSFQFKLAGTVLSNVGGLAAAPFLLVAGEDPLPAIFPHWDIRVAETENHRLMIETSRFLTNADIIRTLEAEDYDRVEDVKDDQIEVRDWLLHRLQQIAAHDFDEYNARPYTRYSLESLLNLHDFTSRAADPDLQTAAHIVLDLSAAKFAIESNRGRRVVPFRRLSENDGSDTSGADGHWNGDLYNIAHGADFEAARAMVLYGQLQLLPDGVPLDGAGTLVNTATSAYEVPAAVIDPAVEQRRPLNQIVVNASIEMVSRSPAFTLSAGGLRSGPTNSTLGFSRNADRGVAMPTVIIPTNAGTKLGDLFGFDGVGANHGRTDNLCIHGGFSCGIGPQLSAAFDCGNGPATVHETLRFINSADCEQGTPPVAMPGPHFYYALRAVDCDGRFCHEGATWGLSEIVEAPGAIAGADPEFQRFRQDREAALRAVAPDDAGKGSYVAADGTQIEFSLAEERPEIVAVNGEPTPPYTTRGDLLDADGQGNATIKGANPVIIDFTDWAHPKRSP